MDAETLEALKGSIAKWERVKADPDMNVGPYSCPLCRLFFFDGNLCVGCPVSKRTGATACLGTPYLQFVTRRSAETAEAELDFLRSLLPTEAAS